MTAPTLWIRKNMLQSPVSDNNQLERQMSENEMRVLRSIQKLSIPEWYLNNSSRPPKILSNDTPIEQRPSSWKNLPIKKTETTRMAIVHPKKSTVCRDGVLETDLEVIPNGSQRFATYKINRASPNKKSPECLARQEASLKCQNTIGVPATSRSPSASQTFPRISPSRKIQNINIVFPQQSENSKCLLITDLDESDEYVTDMTKDSLEVTSTTVPSENERGTRISKEAIVPPIESEIARASIGADCREPVENSSATKAEMEYRTSPREEFPTVENSNIRAASTPRASRDSVPRVPDSNIPAKRDHQRSVSIALFPSSNNCEGARNAAEHNEGYSKLSSPARISASDRKSTDHDPARPSTPFTLKYDSALKTTPERDNKKLSTILPLPIIHFETESPTKMRQSPLVSPLTQTSSVHLKVQNCGACNNLTGGTKSPHRPSGFRLRNMLPSIPEKICAPPPSSESIAETSTALPIFNSTKKSTELEGIVKSNTRSRPGRSLVSEIIEELNRRCKVSSQPSYVSPGSKNFVKKLVCALENGDVLASDEKYVVDVGVEQNLQIQDDSNNSDENYEEDDVFVYSENGSDDDVKSVAISTSISYKGTDSSGSDTDLGSPRTSHNYRTYDWDKNFHKHLVQSHTNNNDDEEKNQNYHDTCRIVSKTEKNDEDWLYWNKKSDWGLPRTSSLLSVVSKASTTSAKRASPCISPIDQSNDQGKFFSSQSGRSSTNTWGTIYRTKKSNANTARRVNEITVLDSGYSDRSSVRSSRSSYIDDNFSGFDSTETTRTASESGTSYYELPQNSVSSYSTMTKTRVHGRPIIV